jgi:hypothetical protein
MQYPRILTKPYGELGNLTSPEFFAGYENLDC